LIALAKGEVVIPPATGAERLRLPHPLFPSDHSPPLLLSIAGSISSDRASKVRIASFHWTRKFISPKESHPGVKLCELATEMPGFKGPGRLLKEYLDKRTAQLGM
jgi:hypothetical protein